MSLAEALAAYEPREMYAHAEASSPLKSHVLVTIEIYLDVHAAAVTTGRRPTFLLVCQNHQIAKMARDMLIRIHETLRLSTTDPRTFVHENILFHVREGRDEKLRGRSWYSWAIFCDPAITGIVPPYVLVRSIERVDTDVWVGRDRDGGVVLHLTDEGAKALLERSTCPITCQRSTSMPPVTYPGWHGLEYVQASTRLRRAFER